MGFKPIVLLGLLFAMVVLITSEVAARDLSETANSLETSDKTEVDEVEDAKYPGGGYGGYPGGGGGYPGGGGGYPGGGRGGYGGGGRGGYGGGGRGGYGGGGRGGYGGGGRGRGGYCRYGCCGGGSYNGRCRCCSYAGQAVDADFQP